MLKMKLLAFGFAAMGATSAHGLSIYDGSAAGKPEAQGSLSYFSSAFAASPTPSGGHVTLTSADAESVGYSNYTIFSSLVNSSFPSLDPSAPGGFTLSFDVKLNSESHTSTDRAGFSVILEGSDKKGIELGFWTNEIFTQTASPLFTHGSQTTGLDPTTPLHSGDLSNHYDLNISGGNYSLAADGNVILSGATQNYDAVAPTTLQYTAYHLPNYVFLGDDTSSASASTDIYNVSIAVPEPGVLAMASVFIGTTLMRRRNRV